MKTSFIWIIGIAAVHFVLCLSLLMLSFSDSMARFDTGEPLSTVGSVIYYTSEILAFPIVKLVEHSSLRLDSTIAQYLPFVANSLVWGWVVVFVFRRVRRTA